MDGWAGRRKGGGIISSARRALGSPGLLRAVVLMGASCAVGCGVI